MKKVFIILIFILFSSQIYSQNINLKYVINAIYNKEDGENFVATNLCYVIPWEINLIDTVSKSRQPINISFFRTTNSFKEYLGKKGEASMLRVRFDAITNTRIIITVSITGIKAKNYTENFKLFEHIDERTVSLRYDQRSKRWIFEKVISVVKDFNPPR